MYHSHAGSTDEERAHCGLSCLQTTVLARLFFSKQCCSCRLHATHAACVGNWGRAIVGPHSSAAPRPTCAPASTSRSSMCGGVYESATLSSRPCLRIADSTAPPSFRAADMWVGKVRSVYF
uniref:Uncharacterized protein n=1 Tax=Rhipicephalus zambeziensis TaxID=60191 RepID=A0A224YET0_9ACAR